MAKRLIDADALKQKATPHYFDNCCYAVSVEDIDDAPTVDAVEVVRCKDCKQGRPINNNKYPEKYFNDHCVVCECESVVGDEPMIYLPSHFCSYGERRTNE